MKETLAKFHVRLLDFRSLDRLIHQESFKQAWNSASNAGRKDVAGFLERVALEAVRKWIRHWENIALEEWSFRRLREKASNLNVPRYSRMTRSELIAQLKEPEDGV